MAKTPGQPEGDASPQDMDLEAQLDDLLHKLEEVDPQTVPADLRKNKLADPVVAGPVAAEAGTEPEAAVEQVAAEAEPVAEADAQAEAEPVTAEPGVQAEAEAEPEIEAETESIPEPASTPQAEAEPVIVDAGESGPVVEEAQTADEGSSASAEPAGAGLDLDAIASMASELLNSQIDAKIDAAAVPDAGPSSPEEIPADVDDAGAPEAGEAQSEDRPAFKALSEDDLTSQIEGLLNQVQGPGAGLGEPQEAEPEPAATAEPTEAGAEAGSAEVAEEAGAVSIDQIDAMLAESAEQAIEHGPEPEADVPPGTDEVLAAQAKAEEEAQARAQADRDAAEPVAASEPEAVSEPEPVPVPVPAPQAEPQPVAVEPMPVPAGASAADVASELDEEAQPVAVPMDESAGSLNEGQVAVGGEAGGQAGGGAGGDEVVIELGGLKKAERALMMICAKINRPLDKLSPEMRDTVGYAGVVTTALALFMVLYGVLF